MSAKTQGQDILVQSNLNMDESLKSNQFPKAIISSGSELHRKESEASLDGKIWDSSYTIINEAQEDLLDKLDDILKHHKGNTVEELPREYHKMRKNIIQTSEEVSLLSMRQNLQVSLRCNLNHSSEDLSIVNQDLIILETLVRQYKTELLQYQRSINQKLKQKDFQIDCLTAEKIKLNQYISLSKDRQFKHQKKISTLQKQNNQLTEQLKDYEKARYLPLKVSAKQKAELYQSHKRIINYQSSEFNDAVRDQLEILIEKLILQLQNEKVHNTRLRNQIKIHQRDLGQLESKLLAQNQHISNLEISKLPCERQNTIAKTFLQCKKNYTALGTEYIESNDQHSIQTRNSTRQTDKLICEEASFSLIQVVNQERQISRIEKLTIGYKIVQFYEAKLSNRNYEILMSEDIIISNYSFNTIEKLQDLTIRSSKIRHKKFESLSRQRQQVLRESLFYNLAFILDTLFKQSVEVQCSSLSDILQSDIRSKIQKIFLERGKKKSKIFYQLKELIASSLSLERDEYL